MILGHLGAISQGQKKAGLNFGFTQFQCLGLKTPENAVFGHLERYDPRFNATRTLCDFII